MTVNQIGTAERSGFPNLKTDQGASIIKNMLTAMENTTHATFIIIYRKANTS